MARFRYTAKNLQGKVNRGVMEAASEKALGQTLKKDGFYLISAKRAGSGFGTQRFNSRQLAEFCRELSSLLTAGVSLVRALDIISNEDGISPFAQGVYAGILEEVKKGISLSEAMESQNCFSSLMLGMIRSGEGNGNLDEVTAQLTVHYEKEEHLNQQVRSAMTYPLLLLVMCVAIVILVMTFVLPQFEGLFAQLESLPVPTMIVMAASDFLVEYWYAAILGALFLVAAWKMLLLVPAIKESVDYLKVHLPVIGKLNQVIYTARFARTLSSLYASGMPIVTSIKTASETIGNKYVEKQFEPVTVKVRSGVPLSEALTEVDGLKKKLASTIRIGEESGRLDQMLGAIAESMELDAQEATKRLVTLLEPVMICVMAMIVGLVIVAVILPIYQSYSAIEGAA